VQSKRQSCGWRETHQVQSKRQAKKKAGEKLPPANSSKQKKSKRKRKLRAFRLALDGKKA
jgi:hypothetical protein